MNSILKFTKDKKSKLKAKPVECLNLKPSEGELWTPLPGTLIPDKSGNRNHGVFCEGKLWLG